MNFFRKNRIIKYLVAALAAIIIFTTTYALILPAITLERKVAEAEAGIELASNVELSEDDNASGFVSDAKKQENEALEADNVDVQEQNGDIVKPEDSAEEVDPDENSDPVNMEEAEAQPVTEQPDDTAIKSEEVNLNDDISNNNPEDNPEDNDAYSEDADAANDGIEDVAQDELANDTLEDEESNFEEISKPEVNFEFEKDNIKVKVEAPEGAFPAGTTMEVENVSDDQDVADAVVDAADGNNMDNRTIDGNIYDMLALDISFYDIDGNKIEPETEIKVTITSDLIKEAEAPVVVHLPEEGDAELIDPMEEADLDEKPADDELVFESNAFSVYAVVYTVDFHYDVDGSTYDFSIPGGGFISLKDVVEALGITDGLDEKYAIEKNSTLFEEETFDTSVEGFVKDVVSVEFSDPELVWTGKVEDDTTLGALKSDKKLSCVYSADLSDGDIKALNETTLTKDDWAIISLKPFSSTEKLTVSMADGEVFTIVITDDQIKRTVISASGDAYEITVTYDENAGIPEGAELRVREILPADKMFKQYYQQSLEKVSGVNTEIEFEPSEESDYARIFDIQIWADEHEVQPKGAVTMSIKLLDAPEETKVTPQVIHFAKEGAELMSLKEAAKNSEDEGIQFVTDEFSVYSVVYTVDFSFNINGQEYAFSLEGGDSTSFKEIIEKFEILDKDNVELFINNIATVDFSNPAYLWNGKLEEDSFAGDLKKKYHLDIQYASNIREGNILAMNVHHYSAPDWVLIALKPFTSEETLTITMKNGEKFTVKVTDAQSDAIHNSDGTVQTIPNPQGTTFELFNYYVDSNTKTTSGRDQWPGHIHNETDFWMFNWYDLNGNYACDWGDGFNRGYDNDNNYLLGYGNNLGINNGHVFKFSPANAGTVIDGTKGTATKDVDGGSGLNGWTQDADPKQGIVQGTLENGYPVMTTDSNLGTDGESLAYLFDSSSQVGKDSYGNVNNLLYVDPDGYYTYDSRDFKAEYQNNGTFKVSDQPDTSDTEVKGFWPFGTKVYWCGLHMNTQFSIPVNGQVLNPKDELKDMQFEFSGDDDTWLYIDGVLVGDGGGIHNRTEIDINFATGKVIVTGKKDSAHMGSFEETKWLDDIFRDAGKYNEADWEDIGDGSGHKRFKAGTYHTFDMFYLERGGGESNLYIHYNLVSTDDFTGHKSFEGFAEDERMSRDQFRFEMIGLDGQYQSVWNSETESADVTLLDPAGRAIMPSRGNESGEGTFADPSKVYSSSAYTDSNGITHGGTIFTTGVLENGDIRFGSADISAEEMLACDQGRPSLYHYIIREKVPDDAVNDDGITWAEADEETREAGGFVKDQVLYDGEVYYMTARVTSWDQSGADGQTYKAYGLSKTYYTDDTFTEVDNNVSFVDFRNLYAPESGRVEFKKVDGFNSPLSGAEFTLYNDSACTSIAKDLGNIEAGIEGTDQIKVSGADGIIAFENMAAPRTYYMKETTVPYGYEPNNTVYKVVIEDSKDTTKSSKITIVGDETETEVTEIVNLKAGQLSVIKAWQDKNGNPVSGGDYTARVKIQRNHYVIGEASSPRTVNFTIQIQNHSDLVYTYTASNVVGGTVTVDWWDTNQGYNSITVVDAGGNNKDYTLTDYWDETNHKNRKITIPDVNSDINVTVVYPQDKDWLFNSEHTPWMKAVSVAGSGPSYELLPDTEFNASTDTSHYATLDSSTNWSKIWTIGEGKDFPATDGSHPYSYYVVEVDENGNTYAIDQETEQGYTLAGYSANNAEGVAGQGAITVYNKVETGSLKITKKVTINSQDPENVAEDLRSLADGTYVFRVYNADGTTLATKADGSAIGDISITIENGASSTVEVTDLEAGTYVVKEISGDNASVSLDFTDHTVTVTKGQSGDDVSAAGTAEVTNSYTSTGITVQKLWQKADGTTDTTKTGDITFTLIQTAHTYTEEAGQITDTGEVDNSETAYTGAYTIKIGSAAAENKTNQPEITFASGQTVTLTNLPKFGHIDGQDVLYIYSVRENAIAGYTGIETQDENGNWTIVNRPSAPTDEETTLTVTKLWQDAAGEPATLVGTENLEYAIKERRVKTEYEPVTITLYNPFSTSAVAEKTIYVKKGTMFNYTMGEDTLTGATHYVYVRINGGSSERTSGPGNTITDSFTVNGDSSISVSIQSFGLSVLGRWADDPWSESSRALYTWFFDYSATSDYKEAYTDLVDLFQDTTSGPNVEEKTYLYTMTSNSSEPVTDSIGEVTTSDFVASFTGLPLFKKVGDDYYAFYYTVDEVKVNNESVDQTTKYIVSVNGTTITNREKPGSIKITKLVTVNGQPTTGTDADGTYTFNIYKSDGTTPAVNINGTAVGAQTIEIKNGVVFKVNGAEVDSDHGFALIDNLMPGDYVVEEAVPDNQVTLYSISGGKGDGNVSTRKVTVTAVAGDSTAETAAAATVYTNNKMSDLDIHIQKVDTSAEKNPLTGASFQLLQYDENYRELLHDYGEFEVSQETGKEGSLTFEGLGEGYYMLVEKKTPAGYIKTNENPRFSIAVNPNTKRLAVVFEDTDMVNYRSADQTFVVQNEPGAALPQAGGIGTTIFTIVGGLMALIAGILYCSRRRVR